MPSCRISKSAGSSDLDSNLFGKFDRCTSTTGSILLYALLISSGQCR